MLIITNFKSYPESTYNNSLKLAKIHYDVAKKLGVSLAIAPTIMDLDNICLKFPRLPVIAQHIDPVEMGACTGKISARLALDAGACGTLLNHSENRIPKDVLYKSVKIAKKLALKVIVCVENVAEGEEVLKNSNPDFIALEPRELIGGNISISTAQPKLIIDAVKKIGSKKLIVGAGIKTSEDVIVAKELGASGILLASGVVLSKDPKKVLMDLFAGC